MENKNHMITELYNALIRRMGYRNRMMSEANRYNLSIRQDELFDRSQTVVFIYKLTDKYCYLQFCCPVTVDEYRKLAGSDCAAMQRSSKYIKTGVDEYEGRYHAYSSIRFPLDGAIDFISALEYLRKELEKYLLAIEPGVKAWSEG